MQKKKQTYVRRKKSSKHRKIIEYTIQIILILIVMISIFLYMIIPKINYFKEQNFLISHYNLTKEQKQLLINPYNFKFISEEEKERSMELKAILGESFEKYKNRYIPLLQEIKEQTQGGPYSRTLELIDVYFIKDAPTSYGINEQILPVLIPNIDFENEFDKWTAFADFPVLTQEGCLHGSCLEIKTSDSFKTMQLRSDSVFVNQDGTVYWTLVFVKCIKCDNDAVYIALDAFNQEGNSIRASKYIRIPQFIKQDDGFVPYLLLTIVSKSRQHNAVAINIIVNSENSGISDDVHVLVDMPTQEEIQTLTPLGQELFKYYLNQSILSKEQLIDYYNLRISSDIDLRQ